MAKNHATTIIPTHHTRAIHISFPIGSLLNNARIASTRSFAISIMFSRPVRIPSTAANYPVRLMDCLTFFD